MSACNELYIGSKQPFHKRLIKNCRMVSCYMKGGKPVNVSNSITPQKARDLQTLEGVLMGCNPGLQKW
jgi:hypothetical protein